MNYVVLVDSSSDLPKQHKLAEGIVVVPMPVNIEGKTYLEGVDIFPEEFYSRFPTFTELPKTSQPNLSTLKDTYEQLLSSGKEIVALHLSSGLSSTVNTTQMARDMTSNPEKIHIVDSLGATFGYGLIAMLAKQILETASSWEEAEPKILKIRDQMRYIFTLDTLEYLVKGGRINKTAGFIGGLIDLKPILHITSDGRLEALAKVRSRKSALHKLIDIMENEVKDPENQIIGISHSACLDDAEYLAKEIRSRFQVKDIIITDIGCVIGSHTGPGTVCLFYQK